MVARGKSPEQVQKETERKNKEELKRIEEDKKAQEAAAAAAEAEKYGIPGDADGDKKADIGVSTDITGRTYLKESGSEKQVWLVPDPRDPNSYTYTNDFDIARKSVQQQYIKRDGDLEGLRKELYSKGYITEQAYRQKDNASLNKALFESLTQYGIDQSDAVANGLQPNYMSFMDYVSTLSRSISGGPKTTVSRRITTRGDSDEEVNALFNQYLGRRATKKEREDYFTALNKAEKNAVVKRTTTESSAVETGELVDSSDKLYIFGKIASTAIKGTDVEVLIKGGGTAAQSIMELKQYAAQNGYRISDEEARSMVVQVLTKPGITIETFKTKIKGVSRSMYSNLELDENIDVGDLALQFAREKENLLELAPGSVTIFDKDVQDALRNNGNKGPMDMTNYNIKLRNNPQWSKTQNAIEEAARYANSVLESFGLI